MMSRAVSSGFAELSVELSVAFSLTVGKMAREKLSSKPH